MCILFCPLLYKTRVIFVIQYPYTHELEDYGIQMQIASSVTSY